MLLFWAASVLASPGREVHPAPAHPLMVTEEDEGSWPVVYEGRTAWFDGYADPRTGTAHRMFGALDLGFEVRDEEQAIDVAWTLLEDNEWLLQVPLFELRLARVELLHGQWVVLFERWHGGYRVEGAQVDVRIRRDRVQMVGLDTFPFGFELPWEAPATDEERVWVPLDRGGELIGVLADRVEVQEHGAWELLYLQGEELVAREQLLREFTGRLQGRVDDRSPSTGGSSLAGLPLLELGGRITATDGSLDLEADFASSTALSGRYIELRGAQGSWWSGEVSVSPSSVEHELSASGDDTSYLDVYVYGNAVSQRVRELDWGNDWARAKVPAYVNIQSTCNAYYDGWSINFYRAGGGCNNTGRIKDIVFHEFGHGTHYAAIVSGGFDGSVSEGAGDYLSATMNDDPQLAPGFFTSGGPLRDADNSKRYPQDLVGEVHSDGEIYVAALWHLREELIAKHGYQVGVERADALWYATLQGSDNMTDAYGEAILRADEDGSLDNGVLDGCEIASAFDQHGLLWGPTVRSSLELRHVPGSRLLKVQVLHCGSTPQRVWAEFEDGSTLELSDEGGQWVAEMPSTPGVRTYTVVAEDGSDRVEGTWSIPIGPVKTLSCTSFEEDWGGFTHGATSLEGGMRALDEWQRGRPRGHAGDPVRARDGDLVAGIDLGAVGDADGRYEANGEFWLKSPSWSVSGENPRLRFWTKLQIEDEFDQAWMVVNGQRVEVSSSADWSFWEFPVEGPEASLELWLSSDAGVERGGWTLDHVCVVVDPDAPDDPGRGEDGLGGFGGIGQGAMVSSCGCGGGPVSGGLVGLVLCLAGLRRRRDGRMPL